MIVSLSLLGLIAAMLAMQGIILLAHRFQHRMGTMLLGAVTGIAMFGVGMFAGVVPVLRLTDNLVVLLLSAILYSNLVAAILIVYICDGTKAARRLLLVMIGSFALTIILQEIIEAARQAETIAAFRPLAGGLYNLNLRILVAAAVTLIVAFLSVIFTYQLLANHFPVWPRGLRIFLVLLLVFLLDGLLFVALGYSGDPRFVYLLTSQLFSKIFAALVLAPGAIVYVTRVLRTQLEPGSEGRPVFDVLNTVTEMDREMTTILSNMVDGLILFTLDGTVTRANRAAEKLLGRPLVGLRLDDPAWRLTYADGTILAPNDSPLIRVLRERRPSENEEFGIRQPDGALRIFSVNVAPMLDTQNRMRGALATFRDITQRKQIDESLAASQDFLKRLIDQAPIGIAVFDREGVAEHVNGTYMRLLGLSSPNQVIGQINLFKDKLFASGDILKYFVQAYKGRAVTIPPKVVDMSGRRVLDLEGFSYPENGGAQTPFKILSHDLFPVYDRRDKVSSVVALVTDLTERTQAEHRQQQISARYQDMVSRISDYLFSAKVQHGSLKYEFCTPAVEKVTGYREEFFLNDDWFWFTIIDAGDKPRVQQELVKLLERRDVDDGVIEYRIRARRGETRWVQSRFTFLRGAEGGIERLIGAVSDITGRKAAEEALRQSVHKFRGLIESMHDFVVTMDMQGRITYANPTFTQTFDLGARAVLGKEIYRYLHPADREKIAAQLRELAASEKPIRKQEVRLRNAQEEYVPLVMNADVQYDENGQLNGMIIVASEMASRKSDGKGRVK
jgi:PAS domain S-box-containing protein